MAKGPNRLGEKSGPLIFPLDARSQGLFPRPANGPGQTTRLFARVLAPMQIEGVAVCSRTGRAWRMASDEGAYLGGHDAAPFPPGYFMAGVVSAYMNAIEALAATRGIGLDAMRLVLEGDFAMSGSLLRGSKRAHVRNMRLKAQVKSATGADLIEILVRDAVRFSAYHDMISRSREGVFTLTHNQDRIPPGRVIEAVDAVPADPVALFETAVPMAGEWDGIVTRFANPGATDQQEAALAGAVQTDYAEDSSLVRVFCEKRADGLKQIVQHLYNPNGTVYRFFSEEAEEGRTPRAPDAASLVAAGIGFCFLTQLRRYAEAVDIDYEGCRMVQDAPFCHGGASADGGRPGRAEPVVAHVFLDTDDDDETAQRALDMAEQTCFLHAIGKDRVPVEIRVESL